MLTPEQIKQARQQYGITTDPTALDTSSSSKGLTGDALGNFLNDNKPNTLANIGGAIVKPVERLGASVAQGIHDITGIGTDLAPNNQATGVFGNKVDILGTKDGKPLDNTGTAKDIAGNVLENAAMVAPVGKIGTGADAILQSAKQGAVAGGMYGAGQGLEDQKDLGGVLASSAEGALAGGAIGGAIPTVASGIKKLAEPPTPQEIQSFAKELVSPKPTEAVKEAALKQGRVVEPGVFSTGKILPSSRDTQLASAVQDYISPKASPVENLSSISDGVSKINKGVKEYVAQNKVPFNTSQLKSQLNQGKDELNLIFASDSNAKKTYDAVVNEFVKHVKNKDTAGLFQARQEFDKIPAIKKLLDSQGLGENTKKEVVLTVRDMANKYIANLLPEGNQYRNQLLQESKMIEAIGNIAEKNTNIIGTNKLELLTKKYPILKWVAGGLVGAGGVGVGGALIGSTD